MFSISEVSSQDLGFGYLRHKDHVRCSAHQFWGHQQTSWPELGDAPQRGSGIPESQIHLPSFLFLLHSPHPEQDFNGKDTANFDELSLLLAQHVAKPSRVFQAGEHKGHVQALKHPPSLEAPTVKRPGEKREHCKETFARIQHIFFHELHSWEQISAFWLKLRRVISLQADTSPENFISNHSSLAKPRATANTDL